MVGRYTGRWTFGHPLWVEYPTIGFALRHQTRLIQFRRGIGKKQPELDSSDDDFPYERTASQMLNIGGNDAQPISSSSDSLSGGAVDSQILEDDEVDDLMPISALGLEVSRCLKALSVLDEDRRLSNHAQVT